jgi:hypothetical protein
VNLINYAVSVATTLESEQNMQHTNIEDKKDNDNETVLAEKGLFFVYDLVRVLRASSSSFFEQIRIQQFSINPHISHSRFCFLTFLTSFLGGVLIDNTDGLNLLSIPNQRI